MYFHQVDDVKFTYDSHGQTFLSTLYSKERKQNFTSETDSRVKSSSGRERLEK